MSSNLSRQAPAYDKTVFAVPSAIADEAAGILMAHGALGCAVNLGRGRIAATATSWNEPPPSPTNGRKRHRDPIVKLEAYFDHITPSRLSRIHRALLAGGFVDRDRAPQTVRIVDPGWSTRWMTRFKPFAMGRRLLIAPPWSETQRRGRMRLVINPGQGFGTGHHGSTAGALRMIERLCDGHRVRDGLDVGCGSGILAIAMHLFGVARIVAIDSDPIAIENARENLELNGVTGIRLSTAPVTTFKRQFDLIAANILGSILIELAPALIRLMRPGGHLVLGGILKRERDLVLEKYGNKLRLADELTDRGWATLVLQR
ncbi:MAG: 50S ribosomal protein L11 methyltransferase [Candidatus Binataceae bacterium]|nr:50S ribosomal protein L11 methyltransferase [Candidatus Binataceae bacterium]